MMLIKDGILILNFIVLSKEHTSLFFPEFNGKCLNRINRILGFQDFSFLFYSVLFCFYEVTFETEKREKLEIKNYELEQQF